MREDDELGKLGKRSMRWAEANTISCTESRRGRQRTQENDSDQKTGEPKAMEQEN